MNEGMKQLMMVDIYLFDWYETTFFSYLILE